MSEIPNGLRYAKSHEWVREEGDGVVAIGVTDHAQMLLGDLVFVELPEVGIRVESEGECGVVESVKAASDLYAPVAGRIKEVNEDLADAPETINQDPYGDGWIFKLELEDPAQLDELLDADAYAAHAEAESE